MTRGKVRLLATNLHTCFPSIRHPTFWFPCIRIRLLNDLRALIEKSAIDRARRMVNLWRQTTFVNCWCASDHES